MAVGLCGALAVIATSVALLASSGTAARESLKPNVSIGPVHLHETRAEVHRALGEPGIAQGTHSRFWYPHHKLTVAYSGRGEQEKAVFIFTRDPRYRTSSGLSVGSKMSDVARLVPGIFCSESGTNCQLGGKAGKPATLVGGVRGGRVTEIGVLTMSSN